MLSTLTYDQLRQFSEYVNRELKSRTSNKSLPNLNIEPFFKTIELDLSYQPKINLDTLSAALIHMTDETLLGVKKQTELFLTSKTNGFFLNATRAEIFHDEASIAEPGVKSNYRE